MKVEPSATGAIHRAVVRGVSWSLLSCLWVGCATDASQERTDGERAEAAGIVDEFQFASGTAQDPPPPKQDPKSLATGTAPAAPDAPTRAEALTMPVETVAPPRVDWLNGSLAVRYRGRSDGEDSDHTLGAFVAMDAINPNVPWVAAHVQARVDIDMDGDDVDEAFADLSDTYDHAVVGKLYLAHVDIGVGGNTMNSSSGVLRVGRQSDPLLPEELRLDGMSYTTKPMGKTETQLGAYAGIPVHLYEDDTDEGQAYGLFVEGLAGKDGRARFDWMHLEDELVLEDHRNDLFSVALWENFSENVRFEGQYSHLDSDPRDLRLRVFVDTPDATTIVRASYYQLLETQTAEATEIDPFFEELLDYFPFRQGTVNVSQLLGENTTLDVGFDARRVSDSDDIGDFNRDWERYYTTLALGLGEHETTLSVTADLWEGGDRDTSTFGADLSFSPSESFDAAIGSYYSLYKYDLFEFEERDDVRTYYARIDHETSKQVKFELIYEFENDDLDTYHTLRLGAVWQF